MRILKELEAHFVDLQILKDLEDFRGVARASMLSAPRELWKTKISARDWGERDAGWAKAKLIKNARTKIHSKKVARG